MTRSTHFFVFLLLSVFLLSSCAQAPDSDKATVSEAKPAPETPKKSGKKIETAPGVRVNNVDIKTSSIGWVGTKPTGQHNGTFKVKNGRITTKEDKIVGGEFVIDIKSLSVDDLEGDNAANLKGHLLSDDFFKASSFPEAKFVVTDVNVIKDADADKAKFKGATHNVKGNLTLLGVTKNIAFPARLFVSNKDIKVEADFNINRADWGISYGNDKSLGDKFIRPEVNIKLDIKS